MLEHIIGQVKPETKANSRKKPDNTAAEDHYREEIRSNINTLYADSRQGLWRMAAFLLISIIALLCRDVNLLDTFPENVREILGAPPSPYLIHIVLAVSTVSALIIIAGRLANGSGPGRVLSQLGHRSAFYILYFFSNALDQYFMLIFLTGLAVLTLEHFHIWTYYARAIRREKELLKKPSLWPLMASAERK